MANAVASSSRDRTAQPRTSLHSLHSLHQYDPNQAVIMTDEIIRRRPNSGIYIRMVNQYGFKVKVGKGQHGEVFLAENIHQNCAPVVSALLCLSLRSLPYHNAPYPLCGPGARSTPPRP